MLMLYFGTVQAQDFGLASGVVGYAKITFLNFNQRAKGKSVARNA
jgi:hypothetical protein